jgi:hypothetical protein
MAAPKGNTYWQLVANWKKGKDPRYSPDELWGKAVEYFEWAESNPLISQAASAGKVVEIEKRRPFTIESFCLFAQMGSTTYQSYRKKEAYAGIVSRIDTIIRANKFEGAMVGDFNNNIVARDLGLIDKQEVTDSTIAAIMFGEDDAGL